MKNYFSEIPQYELINMFHESENTLTKTGWFSKEGILLDHYNSWCIGKQNSSCTTILFLLDLYHALCKEITKGF